MSTNEKKWYVNVDYPVSVIPKGCDRFPLHPTDGRQCQPSDRYPGMTDGAHQLDDGPFQIDYYSFDTCRAAEKFFDDACNKLANMAESEHRGKRFKVEVSWPSATGQIGIGVNQ